MEEMTRLIEEGADNIMPFSDGKFEMGLEENYGEQMVPSTFMSYLEDEVKEIKCLFWAVYCNNNLFDLKSTLITSGDYDERLVHK